MDHVFARRRRGAVRRRHGAPDGPSRFDGLIQCFALRRRRRVYRIIAQYGLEAREVLDLAVTNKIARDDLADHVRLLQIRRRSNVLTRRFIT